MPISLAIPSILTLSATAAWTPLVTVTGAGFGAQYDAVSNPGDATTYYFWMNHPKNLYSYSGCYPSGGGSFVYQTTAAWTFGDNVGVEAKKTHLPAGTLIASITDGGTGLANVSLTWH